MQNSRKTFEGALHIVTKARAADAGVKLTIGGTSAYATKTEINIPALAPGDDDARLYALGLTAHETGHCRHTDFGVLAADGYTPFEQDLMQAMEDPRVDHLQAIDKPGLKADRDALLARFLEDGTLALNENATVQHNLAMYVGLRLQQLYNDQKIYSDVADQFGAWVSAKIPQAAMVRLEASLPGAMAAKSTADVAVVARRIATVLKEEAEKAKEQAQQQQQQGQSQQQEQQPGADGDGGQGGDQGPDQQSAAGQEPGDGNMPGNSNSGDGQPKGDQPGAASAGNEEAKADALLAALEGDKPQYEGLGEAAVRKLNEHAQQSHADKLGDYELVYAQQSGGNQQLVDAVRGETNALRRRVAALIQTQAMQSTSIRNVGRRLSIPHLLRVKTGDDRVFRRVSEGVGVSTAVEILLDASTSMAGSQYELAKHAAAAVALSLGTVQGAAVEVSNFPIGSGRRGAEVLCPFDVPLQRVANNLASSSARGSCTPLAEALLAAGASLNRRTERRKLLLVCHDGKPSMPDACRKLVGELEAMGVEVFGLGIRCDTRHIFDRSILLNDAGELPRAIFALLEGRLFDLPMAA